MPVLPAGSFKRDAILRVLAVSPIVENSGM